MLTSGSQAGAEVFSLPRRKGLNWTTTIAMGLFHVGAIAALFMFNWRSFWVAVFLYWVCTGLGISMDTTVCIRTGGTNAHCGWNTSLLFAVR